MDVTLLIRRDWCGSGLWIKFTSKYCIKDSTQKYVHYGNEELEKPVDQDIPEDFRECKKIIRLLMLYIMLLNAKEFNETSTYKTTNRSVGYLGKHL